MGKVSTVSKDFGASIVALTPTLNVEPRTCEPLLFHGRCRFPLSRLRALQSVFPLDQVEFFKMWITGLI